MRICLECGADHTANDETKCTTCGGPVTRMHQPSDPLIGRDLGGRYVLQVRLGEGGFGSVYRGQHTKTDQLVAIKILKADFGAHPQVLQRFYAEAKNTSKLRHPHNVTVFDFGHTDDGLVYIAMELVDGTPLSAFRSIPQNRVVRILEQIAAAVGEAHELGLIHRDLKPDNVMLLDVDGQDFCKVLDYGIAKLENSSTGLTRTGGFVGTPAYASPEQVSGQTLDRRADIYAFGVMAFEFVSGRLPFEADDAISLAVAHRMDEPPPLRSLVEVSPALDALIMDCLQKDPNDRPQTMLEVRERLGTVPERGRMAANTQPAPHAGPTALDVTLDPVTRTQVPMPAPAVSKSRSIRAGAAVVAVICLLALAAYGLQTITSSGPDAPDPTADVDPAPNEPAVVVTTPATSPEAAVEDERPAETDPIVAVQPGSGEGSGERRAASGEPSAESDPAAGGEEPVEDEVEHVAEAGSRSGRSGRSGRSSRSTEPRTEDSEGAAPRDDEAPRDDRAAELEALINGAVDDAEDLQEEAEDSAAALQRLIGDR